MKRKDDTYNEFLDIFYPYLEVRFLENADMSIVVSEYYTDVIKPDDCYIYIEEIDMWCDSKNAIIIDEELKDYLYRYRSEYYKRKNEIK